MFKRQQASVLLSRITEPRHFIQVVAGARQVGKSTLVKQVANELTLPHLLTTAEDAPDKNPGWIRYVWQQARQSIRLNNYSEFLLVIDEIHKLDNWSEVVKAEWDADTMRDVNIKVVLLGSSRLLIKDGLNESLAGRYELIEMEHWSYNDNKRCVDNQARFETCPFTSAFLAWLLLFRRIAVVQQNTGTIARRGKHGDFSQLPATVG